MLTRRISLLYWSNAPAQTFGKKCASSGPPQSKDDVQEFTSIELYPKYSKIQRKKREVRKTASNIPPRSASMVPDQDWGNVWPTARSFHPATVPLPVRMGLPTKSKPTPDKWGNAELMKIPNFLHLTPPVVQRHCAAIRKFCTPWPDGVCYPSNVAADVPETESEEAALKKKKKKQTKEFYREITKTNKDEPLPEPGHPGYFPCIQMKSSYLYSGPSVRDNRARIATIKFQIEDLGLSAHGQDKLLRLVDDKFDPQGNTITLTVDRCPLYSQNLEYAHYLMTVLRAEAEKEEPWEHEMGRQDHSEFIYEGSNSQRAVSLLRETLGPEQVSPEMEEKYKASLHQMLNECESDATLHEYSSNVLKMMGIAEPMHNTTKTLNPTLSADFDASLPSIDITNLPTWHYQEKKKVVWISHAWKLVKEWW